MPNIFYIRYYNEGSAIVKSIPDFFQKNIQKVTKVPVKIVFLRFSQALFGFYDEVITD